MGLPLPRAHPDIRHEKRLEVIPDRTLHLRTCDKSGDQILSVYDANVPQRVYKRELYGKVVY